MRIAENHNSGRVADGEPKASPAAVARRGCFAAFPQAPLLLPGMENRRAPPVTTQGETPLLMRFPLFTFTSYLIFLLLLQWLGCPVNALASHGDRRQPGLHPDPHGDPSCVCQMWGLLEVSGRCGRTTEVLTAKSMGTSSVLATVFTVFLFYAISVD